MITREIRSYVSRDWRAARESKDAFWAARIARLGPIEGLRIADELRRQVVRQNPDWPNDEERHEDLAAHIRLSVNGCGGDWHVLEAPVFEAIRRRD